jgi:hypothetical protein
MIWMYELLSGKCWHEWRYFKKMCPVSVPFRNAFLRQKYGQMEFTHRQCEKCNQQDYRTRLPILHGGGSSHDPNEWRPVK